MRITTYKTIVSDTLCTCLMKEKSFNYPSKTSTLNSPETIAEIMRNAFHLDKLAEEQVYLIALNSKCLPIGFFEVSHGTVNSSLVSTREVFVRLCLCGAAFFVLCHNHPSGFPEPSIQDTKTTTLLQEAGKLMNIPMLDHIIVCQNEFYSFRSETDIFS